MPKATNTPATLVAVASHLLEIGGPEAVTLRAVGSAAGLSRTAPYRHFKDKEDLLRAVATETLKKLTTAMHQGANNSTHEASPLYRACLGYAQEALNHPEQYKLVFGSRQFQVPSQSMNQAADTAVSNFYNYVAKAQEEEGLMAGDVRIITAIVWSSLHGMVSLAVTGHLREPRMVDGASRMPELIATMLQGMRPPGQNVNREGP